MTKWRWMQSVANPSLDEFPLRGKNTGNFLEVLSHLGPVSANGGPLRLIGHSGLYLEQGIKMSVSGNFLADSNPYYETITFLCS
jgi:hypothetical protein